MDITHYEYAPTRSARSRWTLLELDVPYESVSGRELIRSDELRRVHPLGKLPAAEIDGRPLFESGALCTFFADAHPDKGLIGKPGTWERALHDQWVCFTFTELEAWLWHSAKHTFVYPEEERIPEVIAMNGREFRTAAVVIEDALGASDHLVAGRFSVTDIIASYTLNWGRRAGLTDGFDRINGYLDRLYERPHCTLGRPES
ncbi:MAG: glutathione S-transferase family protein [Hyphomicrobiales bacterium]